jgi:hypothetical protein
MPGLYLSQRMMIVALIIPKKVCKGIIAVCTSGDSYRIFIDIRKKTYIFDWSRGFAVPWTSGPFAPRPSIGSRFFCFGMPAVSAAGGFARKHSTGSRPPAQVRSKNSLHSSQAGTWDGSSEGKWFFQSIASILPVSRKRRICRAVYFMPELLGDGEIYRMRSGQQSENLTQC